MYTYVYTWSKLAYCESNHVNDKRGYREATETPREATEAPRRPRRSPLSPTKATEIIAKTALQIPLSESQQRRDDRLSRRRERERKHRLRKQQRNERYAWGGVGRETELGGLLRLWRPNQRKERLA